MSLKKHIIAAQLVQLLGLSGAGWWMRNALNTDAVAYLRIAWYYATGQVDLAVSGYWGPMLSWLMAPMIATGLPKLAAARVAMGLSALLFFWGCLAVFRCLEISRTWFKAGTWCAALVSIPWSVINITPDLMLAGWVAVAVACVWRMMNRFGHPLSLFYAVLAGLAWGLAYYTKAIALPVMFLSTAAFAWLWRRRDDLTWEEIGFPWMVMFGVWLLVAGVWIGVLTQHYHRPTFSTAAGIAHAVAGPDDYKRSHPFTREFHKPEPGRITSWEDPSTMYYRDWAPWQSAEYFFHQVKLILSNIMRQQAMLTAICLAWPLILGVLLLGLWKGHLDFEMLQGRWIWALVPLLATLLVLVVGYLEIKELRYLYVLFPYLFVMGTEAFERVAGRFSKSGPWLDGKLASWILALSFVVPATGLAMRYQMDKDEASLSAQRVALQMRACSLPRGAVAGSATMGGGRMGLYLAYFLNQPWYGDQVVLTPALIKASGAKYYVTLKTYPIASMLAREPGVRNLNNLLFPSAQEEAVCKYIVFSL